MIQKNRVEIIIRHKDIENIVPSEYKAFIETLEEERGTLTEFAVYIDPSWADKAPHSFSLKAIDAYNDMILAFEKETGIELFLLYDEKDEIGLSLFALNSNSVLKLSKSAKALKDRGAIFDFYKGGNL